MKISLANLKTILAEHKITPDHHCGEDISEYASSQGGSKHTQKYILRSADQELFYALYLGSSLWRRYGDVATFAEHVQRSPPTTINLDLIAKT